MHASEIETLQELIVTEVSSVLGRLESPRSKQGRQLAAAALARCLALAKGVQLLCTGGLPELGGIVLRSIGEFYIQSLYLLLIDDDLASKSVGAYVRSVQLINQEAGLDLGQVLDEWSPVRGQPLQVERMAREVNAELTSRGEGTTLFRNLYDLLYRSESTFSAHGVGPLIRYLDGDDTVRLRATPTGFLPCSHMALLSNLLVAHLASMVFKKFDQDANEMELLLNRLCEAAEREVSDMAIQVLEDTGVSLSSWMGNSSSSES